MSVQNTTNLEQFALRYPCPACGAARGFWCAGVSGLTEVEMHDARLKPMAEYGAMKYDDGFEMGEAGADPVHDVPDDPDDAA